MYVIHKFMKRGKSAAPMLVQPLAHCSDSPRINVVDAPRSFSNLSNQARFLQHLKMLRNRRSAYRQAAREITDRPRPFCEALEDFAPSGVT